MYNHLNSSSSCKKNKHLGWSIEQECSKLPQYTDYGQFIVPSHASATAPIHVDSSPKKQHPKSQVSTFTDFSLQLLSLKAEKDFRSIQVSTILYSSLVDSLLEGFQLPPCSYSHHGPSHVEHVRRIGHLSSRSITRPATSPSGSNCLWIWSRSTCGDSGAQWQAEHVLRLRISSPFPTFNRYDTLSKIHTVCSLPNPILGSLAL